MQTVRINYDDPLHEVGEKFVDALTKEGISIKDVSPKEGEWIDYEIESGTKSHHQQRIESFMQKFGQEVPNFPTQCSEKVRILRARLIMEETLETINALGIFITSWDMSIGEDSLNYEVDGSFNMVEVADGCADISIVTIGTLSACGIADSLLLEMVDQNNLDKFADGYYIDEHGKLIKPPNHRPPNIERELVRQGWEG